MARSTGIEVRHARSCRDGGGGAGLAPIDIDAPPAPAVPAQRNARRSRRLTQLEQELKAGEPALAEAEKAWSAAADRYQRLLGKQMALSAAIEQERSRCGLPQEVS